MSACGPTHTSADGIERGMRIVTLIRSVNRGSAVIEEREPLQIIRAIGEKATEFPRRGTQFVVDDQAFVAVAQSLLITPNGGMAAQAQLFARKQVAVSD